MENLIDSTYFEGEIALPIYRSTNEEALDSDIKRFQEDILIKLLGYELYALLETGYIAQEQRFLDLVNGKVFSFNYKGHTVTRKYRGMKNADKKSFIAYYVYFYHLRNKATSTTDTHELIPDNENGENASSYNKLVRGWNLFIESIGEPDRCISFDKFDLSTYGHMDDSGSLFNFLLANKDTYPEWEFEPFENINYMGL